MKSALYSILALSLAACTATDTVPSSGEPGLDSAMVVDPSTMVPSDDRPTVVFLGTSLTAGLGLERAADTYVSVLAAMADSAGKPFRALNAGVSGETSAGGLRRLDWILREPFDVLFLELGANDGLRGQDPRALASNLTGIIRRTRTRYPDVRVVVAGMEAPPNLGDLYTSAFRSVFRAVAESEETDLIPFLLDGVAGIPELNQADRIHPTTEGHRRTAANAWPVLEAVLDGVEKEGA
ncbi:MAG: arylesterase [Longimicrobiales bacterium]|nr:arylesterase [Longimicrobiales bacterium]